MEVPFNDLYIQHSLLIPEIMQDIEEGIRKSAFILGEDVENFESNFAKWGGFKYVVGVANGSDALRIALAEVGVNQGDKVIVAANTYFAAPAAITQLKATPVFIDVDIDSRFPNIDSYSLSDSDEIKAVIRSHLFGGADIEPLPLKLRDKIQIHDSSQAHGTLVNGEQIGRDGTSTFSFYPGKNLGAFGDAGAITTISHDLYNRLLKHRNQGTGENKYKHEIIGSNSRLDSLQARILSIKLKHLDHNNQLRQNVVNRYLSNMNGHDARLKFFKYAPSVRASNHLFQIRLIDIDARKIIEFLKTKGISCGQHYPIPLHLQPAFKFLNYSEGDFPNCEKLAKETFSLPLYPDLSHAQIDYVSENVLHYLAEN